MLLRYILRFPKCNGDKGNRRKALPNHEFMILMDTPNRLSKQGGTWLCSTKLYSSSNQTHQGTQPRLDKIPHMAPPLPDQVNRELVFATTSPHSDEGLHCVVFH